MGKPKPNERKLKHRRKTTLHHAVATLEQISAALVMRSVRIEDSEQAMILHPPEDVALEVKAESGNKKTSLTIKLTWNTAAHSNDEQAAKPVGKDAPSMVGTRSKNGRVDTLAAALRTDFRHAIQRREYQIALDIGRQIISQLPNSPLASEFEQLQPVLQRRAEMEYTHDAPKESGVENPKSKSDTAAILCEQSVDRPAVDRRSVAGPAVDSSGESTASTKQA